MKARIVNENHQVVQVCHKPSAQAPQRSKVRWDRTYSFSQTHHGEVVP
jgi:hypothetical protein